MDTTDQKIRKIGLQSIFKKNPTTARLKSVKSASMSVIKKGIKMGATGFQQASTQIKKKTASPGLSQIYLLKYTSQNKIFKLQSKSQLNREFLIASILLGILNIGLLFFLFLFFFFLLVRLQFFVALFDLISVFFRSLFWYIIFWNFLKTFFTFFLLFSTFFQLFSTFFNFFSTFFQLFSTFFQHF